MKIDNFEKLMNFSTFRDCEDIIKFCNREGLGNIKIDYATQTILFN
jgi:translation initiation factor 3 subunit A